MQTILIAFHILLSIALVGLVLLQRGRGAEVGAAFGSGASSTVFGARGSASFLSRATAIVATLFFVSSLTLAYLAIQQVEDQGSVMEQVETTGVPSDIPVSAPAADVPQEPVSGEGTAGDVPAGQEAAPADVPNPG